MSKVFITAAKGLMPASVADKESAPLYQNRDPGTTTYETEVSEGFLLGTKENEKATYIKKIIQPTAIDTGFRIFKIENNKFGVEIPGAVRSGPFEGLIAYKTILDLFTETKEKFVQEFPDAFFICAHSDPYFSAEYMPGKYLEKVRTCNNINDYINSLSAIFKLISPLSRTTFVPMSALAQFLIANKLHNGCLCHYGDNSFATAIDDAFMKISCDYSEAVYAFGAQHLFLDFLLSLQAEMLQHLFEKEKIVDFTDCGFSFLFTNKKPSENKPCLCITESECIDFPNDMTGDEAASLMLKKYQPESFDLIIHNGIPELKKYEKTLDTFQKFGFCGGAAAGLNLFMAWRRINTTRKENQNTPKINRILVVSAGISGSCQILTLELL